MTLLSLLKAKCDNCQTIQEVYWGNYGSENSCINCDAAPVCLTKIIVGETDAISCPQCRTKMYGVTEIQNRPFKYYSRCPNCLYETEAI